MLCLSGGLELSGSELGLLCCRFCSKDDAGNNVGHGTAAIGSKNFHCNDIRRLGNAIFARSNCASAVGTMAIVIIINIIQRDSLAPRRSVFELLVVKVDTSVDDIDIDTVASERVMFVLGESAKRELLAVADACETLEMSFENES